MALLQSSVTLKVLVIVIGQEIPSVVSEIKATTGIEQLSAASVMTEIFAEGTSLTHSKLRETGFDAVGAISSFTVIICVKSIVLPQSSVTL